MKRTHSESENDDLYSGDEKEGEEGCGGVSRKRRRGIIEKRRRDRINNSLAELRRLVPAAFEKQGSAKLEKAEILQMTVDHLKMLHTKGLDALTYDPNKFAIDYHNIGFRECAAEVARYMVTIEGMDIQDPLRLRLMSHLQCFAAQREIANKQSTSSWGWSPPTGSTGSTGSSASYPPSPSISGFQGHMLPTGPHHASPAPNHHLSLEQTHGVSAFSAPTSSNNDPNTSCSLTCPSMNQGPRLGSAGPSPVYSVPTTQPHSNYHLNLNAHAFPVNHPNTGHTNIPSLSNPSQISANISPNLSIPHSSSLNGYVGSLQGTSGVKPYRPWGAEIAY